MSENQAVDLRNMIHRSNLIYKNEIIANRQQIYKPGDFIEVWLPRGEYLCNVAKTKLIYRPVIKFADGNQAIVNRGLLMNNAKSCFHVQSMRCDSKMATPGQGERSRPVFNAIKERIVDADKGKNDVLSGVNSHKEYGFDYASEHNADLNAVTTARGADLNGYGYDIDPLYQSARQEYRKKQQYLKRFYSMVKSGNRGSNLTHLQSGDTANDTVTRGVNERQTWFEVDLGDLSIELQTMTMVYMGHFTDGIRITLQLLLPQFCMSLSIPPPVGTVSTQNFFSLANDRYVITDVCLLLRKHDLNPEGSSIMRQVSMQNPVPFITYQYQMRSIDAGDTLTLVDTTTLEASSYLGCLVCFTGTGVKNSAVYPGADAAAQLLAENAAFNYQGATAFNNANFAYDETHFYLETTRAELDVDSTLYKANPMPIGDRAYTSYLQGLDGFGVLFQGKMYDVPFQEFIDKAFIIAIPVNTQGLAGLNTKGKRVTLSLEFASTDPRAATRTNFQVHIFHIITASMKFDSQAGVMIEK